MAQRLTPPLKWHGGKHYLAPRVVALMPPHLHYVEPFAGGLSVLLAKDPDGVSEVVNDANRRLTNFWFVLQSPPHFEEFRRHVEAVPFSEVEFEAANERCRQATGYVCVKDAVHFFLRCRLSLAGRTRSFTGVTRTRTRRGMNNEVSAWLTCVEGLPLVHARLKRVLILNRDALDVIRQQDGPGTLLYLDPPYLHETRATSGEYAHEMTDAQHRDLLTLLSGVRGKFMLSGYRSPMYDEWADQGGHTRHDFDLPNNAAGGKAKRRMTESLWCNW